MAERRITRDKLAAVLRSPEMVREWERLQEDVTVSLPTALEEIAGQLVDLGDVVAEVRAMTRFVDAADIQGSIDANYGRRLVFPAGTYILTEPLTITDSIALEFEPGAVIDISGMAAGTALNQKRAIEITGSLGPTVGLGADISIGAEQIQVASTETFADGDFVVIASSQKYMDGAAASVISRGHLTRVKTIDSGALMTLVERSPFAYTAASAGTVRKVSMVADVTITGGQIICGGVGKAHTGIYAYCTTGLRVRDVVIDGAEDCGVSVWYSQDALIEGCKISDSTSPGGSIGNTGYGVVLYQGTRDSAVANNAFHNCRHAVTGGSTPSPLFNVVRGNRIVDCGIGTHAVDCHEPCFDWTFDGNVIEGGDGGFVIRGQRTKVLGNTVSGVGGSGVRVKSFESNTDGICGTVISGNTIRNTASTGIVLEGVSGEPIIDSVVAGNVVDTAALACIAGQYVQGADIGHNRLRNVTSNTGTEGNAIHVSGAAVGDCSDIAISHNRIRTTMRHGISLQHTSGASLTANDISGVASSPLGSAVFIQNSEDVAVAQGKLNMATTGNYGIQLDTFDRVTINGVRIKGGSPDDANQDGIRAFRGSGTNGTLIVQGCVIDNCARHAVFASETDRVVVTSNDVRGVSSATKVNIVGATTSVDANNIA